MQRNQQPGKSRAEYRRIADIIRAQIDGSVFGPGDKLPTRQQLAKTHRVSLHTIHHAMEVLQDEGLIDSRQGAPTRVSEDFDRRLGPGPYMERALQKPDATALIDIVGFTGTSFRNLIEEPLNKVLLGQLSPQSIAIRLLLPDLRFPIGLPCQADNLGDSPEFRHHASTVMREQVAAITELTHQITAETPSEASIQTRVFRATPLFKLFMIDNSDVFIGYYPVRERVVSLEKKPIAIFDLMSTDVTLVHNSSEIDPTSGQHVTQTRAWFNNIWTTIAKDIEL